MKHVILGAGPVGLSVAAALVRRSESVTLVSRTRPPGLSAPVEHITADARDADALARACAGAEVIYQCLGAPYHRWREELPPLQRSAVAAARRAGARLVSFENVYMYGAPGEAPFSETDSHEPCSEKGRIRTAMVEELQQLLARGELDVIHVRASDLFGPRMRASSLGDEFLGRAVVGKTARGFGDLSAPHTWTFTADAGETLATIGTTAGTSRRVWHVPSDRPRSQHEVAAELSRLLGRQVKVQATPRWLLRLIGLLRPQVGATVEMVYEFERPFIVGDEATRGALRVMHTPFTEALAQTVGWYSSAREVAARP